MLVVYIFSAPFSSDFFQPVENKGAWLQSEQSKKKKTSPPLTSRTLTAPSERCFSCRSPLLISPPALHCLPWERTRNTASPLRRDSVCMQRRNTVKQPSPLPCSRQQQFSGMLAARAAACFTEAAKAARSLAPWQQLPLLSDIFYTLVFSFHAPQTPPLISSCCAFPLWCCLFFLPSCN